MVKRHMNKTKSLIFFEELLLEIWHKLRWYSSGVVLAVITILGIFAGFYSVYHFIFYVALPLIENLVHWLKTENSLYVGGSMNLFPTVDVYFEAVWGIDIFNKWKGLRTLLGWIPFVLIPTVTAVLSIPLGESLGSYRRLIIQKLNQLEESQIDRARAIYLESKGMTDEEGRQEAEETLRLAEEAKKEAQRKALKARKEAREKKTQAKDVSDSAWEKLE